MPCIMILILSLCAHLHVYMPSHALNINYVRGHICICTDISVLCRLLVIIVTFLYRTIRYIPSHPLILALFFPLWDL
ncbi:hypothetical protein BDF22DRAFT_194575 [Syncephalis plumigaleata]|nr:hypothetical protein BDF22DRAFT_194575 [Syncephalis plumigaleata]